MSVYLLFIGLTVLMIINLFLFHSVFHVFYFDLGKGLFKEIVWGYIIAGFEMSLIMAIGPIILGFLGGVLGIAAVAIVLIVIIYAIYRAVTKIKGRTTRNQVVKNDDSFTQNNGNSMQSDDNSMQAYMDILYEAQQIKNENDNTRETQFCPYCGKQILRTVKFCNFCGKANIYEKQ